MLTCAEGVRCGLGDDDLRPHMLRSHTRADEVSSPWRSRTCSAASKAENFCCSIMVARADVFPRTDSVGPLLLPVLSFATLSSVRSLCFCRRGRVLYLKFLMPNQKRNQIKTVRPSQDRRMEVGPADGSQR